MAMESARGFNSRSTRRKFALLSRMSSRGSAGPLGAAGSCVQIGHGFHQAGQVEFSYPFPVPLQCTSAAKRW